MHTLSLTANTKDCQKFGWIFLAYFALFLTIVSMHHHHIYWGACAVLLVCLLSAIFTPKLLLPLKLVWDTLLLCLSYVNTRIIFGFIFLVIFTPIAIVKRFFRKDPLDLKYNSENNTYRTNSDSTLNDLRRPY